MPPQCNKRQDIKEAQCISDPLTPEHSTHFTHFRASTFYTALKLITATEYRYQYERAASAAELSPPMQALLQVLNAIQPVTKWAADERPNTTTFTPMNVDCNPVRLQSMPCALYLTHPDSPSTTTTYLIRPPRPRSDLRGDAYWAPWWRTSILLQSPTPLPLPSMFVQNPHTAQGYLLHALTQGMEMAISYLTSINVITPEYLTTTPTLLPTFDGAYIISHLRKDTSSQLTIFVISLANPQAYAMLATIDTSIKIRLTTTITIAGSHRQQIVHIQLNPHNISILGRAYAGLFQNSLTQTTNPTISIPKVLQTNGLTCRRSEKMS